MPDHGAEMIRLSARFGRGLPAHVIPMEITALSGFGHAEMLAALASGFGHVNVLIGPKTERDALDPQLEPVPSNHLTLPTIHPVSLTVLAGS